jgi:predicted dehydrogenase
MTRIGIIGTGWGARVQVPAFREAGLDVVAIAGHDPQKTRQTAQELSLTPFDDWHALVASDVDLVTIVTPPSEHLAMATAALEAGKHVLCEKPTALNAGEAERLVAAAAKHPSQVALIDHELRFLPSFRAARSFDLGGVRYVEVRYASPGRGDRTRQWNWWSDAAHGGGGWGAVGSHFVDAIRYLVGEVTAAQAMLTTIIGERPHAGASKKVTSDDFASVNLRVGEYVVAALTMSFVSAGPDDPTTITIHGESGALRLTGEELMHSKNNQPFVRVAGSDLAKRPGNSSGGAFGSGTYHLGVALKSALDGGDPSALTPGATFADGLAQQRVLDAARRSAESEGRWVLVGERGGRSS